MKIVLIAKPGHSDSGVGRYVDNLAPALEAAGHEVIIAYPFVPIPTWLANKFKKLLDWDLIAFFLTYPIWIHYPEANIFHITSQNLATLMVFHPPRGKVVVTVHDIIPHLTKKPSTFTVKNIVTRFFENLSYVGIKKCEYIICDTNTTLSDLAKEFNISHRHMQTIHLGT